MADIWMDVDAALAEVPVNILPLLDDGDFKTRETAVAFNAAGMDLVWNFVTVGGAFTQTPVTPTSGGDYDWAHQGDAMYTIEIPASGGASINNDAEGFGWFTGVATGVLPWRGPIIGFRDVGLNDKLIGDPYDDNRGLAGLALPAAAAEAAGGLYTRGSGAGQINQPANGRVDTNVVAMANGVVTAAAVATDAIDADALAADALAEINTQVDTALADYDGPTKAELDSAVAPLALEATAQSIKGQTDNLPSDPADASVVAGLIGAVETKVDTVDAVVDAIKAKTDNLPSDPADQSLIIAATNAIAALIGTPSVDLAADLAALALRVRGLVMAQGTLGDTGNDTTHVHLNGLTYGNDEINGYLLVLFDDSEAEFHARWVDDWVLATELATVATLPFTPEDDTDTFWILPIRKDGALDAAGVRAALGLATANLDTQLSGIASDASDAKDAAESADTKLDAVLTAVETDLPATLATIAAFLDSEIAAILADTNELQTDWANGGRLDLLIDAIKAKTDQLAFTTANQVDARVLTNSDKTGYAIGTGGMAAASFAAGAIDAAALAADAATEIVTAIFARAFSAGYNNLTFDQVMKVLLAAVAGKASGLETTEATYRNLADNADVIVAEVDADGNRINVALTP